jgi:hypothetical protein
LGLVVPRAKSRPGGTLRHSSDRAGQFTSAYHSCWQAVVAKRSSFLSMCVLQRFCSMLQFTPKAAPLHEPVSNPDEVRKCTVPLPRQPKHLVWFHFDTPLKDLSDGLLRNADIMIDNAPETPDVITPFLLVWLQARKRNLWIPSEYQDDSHAISETAALMCSIGATYQSYFTITVLPVAWLYVLLYTTDGAASSLPAPVRDFFNLKQNFRCPMTLENLRAGYSAVILPSLCHLKVNVRGHCLRLSEVHKTVKMSQLVLWPNIDLEMQYESKELLYRSLGEWTAGKHHMLPTEMVKFCDPVETMQQSIAAGMERLKKSHSNAFTVNESKSTLVDNHNLSPSFIYSPPSVCSLSSQVTSL